MTTTVTQVPGFGIGPFPATAFGLGAIAGLPAAVRVTGVDRVLVVTDRGLADSAMIRDVVARLREDGIQVEVYSDLRPNPTTDDVDAGGAAARAAGARVIVAIGGGSALDGAKAISLAATSAAPAATLGWGAAIVGLPVIAVPTTSGTGSETNDFGIVTNVSENRKVYVGGPSCLARSVILDPQLTVSLPPGPTAASGMDCLTHAVESFLSIRANPWADGLDVHVVRMVSTHLRRAVADGTDIEARASLLLAAHTAGQAMSTTGLGIVHGIGHPLGGRHDVPHGVALSLIIGECLRFNRPARLARLARLADPLGVANSAASEDRNADAAITAVEALARDVGMPMALRDFGIDAGHVPQLAEDALADAVMVNTPRPPSTEDVSAILTAVL